VAKEKDWLTMGNGKRILLIGLFINLIGVFLFVNSIGAGPSVYYGQVVGIEFSVL
jgi:hypothetical protein